MEEFDGAYLRVEGFSKPMLNMANFDFLGMGQRKELKAAAVQALDKVSQNISHRNTGQRKTVHSKVHVAQPPLPHADTHEPVCIPLLSLEVETPEIEATRPRLSSRRQSDSFAPGRPKPFSLFLVFFRFFFSSP